MDLDVMQNFEDDEDENDQSDESMLLPLAETLTDGLAVSLQSVDFYIREAIDATHDSRFFNVQMSEIIPDLYMNKLESKYALGHDLW